ncbi:MAG: type VI secretion system baseplate subunit TssE [Deltaproteobacteria bacterium]|nr:type VI secretion system baseplate subunit TssE [Deltaproteobacteria bacterium]
MREERLIQRIRTWKKSPNRRDGEDPKRLTDSIVRHLERILNTRRGSVGIAHDYGIPDLTDFRSGFPDSVRDLEMTIRDTIEKFEPRLKSVRVKFVPQDADMLTVTFQIVAQLALEDEKTPVMFESMMGSDGKVMIRG